MLPDEGVHELRDAGKEHEVSVVGHAADLLECLALLGYVILELPGHAGAEDVELPGALGEEFIERLILDDDLHELHYLRRRVGESSFEPQTVEEVVEVGDGAGVDVASGVKVVDCDKSHRGRGGSGGLAAIDDDLKPAEGTGGWLGHCGPL